MRSVSARANAGSLDRSARWWLGRAGGLVMGVVVSASVLALAVLPSIAVAATQTVYGPHQLESAVSKGGVVRLGGDINVTSGSLKVGPALTLDLNGHTLSIHHPVSSRVAIDVPAGHSLTIEDTSTRGARGGPVIDGVLEIGDGGVVTLMNGVMVTVTNHARIIVREGGRVEGQGTIENFGVIVVAPGGVIADDGRGDGINSLLITGNNYRLLFDLNGGSGTVPDMLVYAQTVSESEQSLPAGPTRQGFMFVGWFTAASGGTEVDDETDLPELAGGPGPKDVKLFAHYVALTISITTPSQGATYSRGESVTSAFTCTAGVGGPPITPCVDQSGRTSGNPVDTSTPGQHTFIVTTANGVTHRVTYTVSHPPPPGPPTASISTPVNGAAYAQGESVASAFSCTAGAGGPAITSCVDQHGLASGNPVDTSTRGQHTFTVTATSADGLEGTDSVTYTVSAPSGCPDPAAVYDRGFNAGFNAGFDAGFSAGFDSGFDAGFNSGFNAGFGHASGFGTVISSTEVGSRSPLARDQAVAGKALPAACDPVFNEGFNPGFDSGFDSGFNRGFDQGFDSGFNSGFDAGFTARHRG